MSDEAREITDEMLLSELTVGEFKQLLLELLANLSVSSEAKATSEIEQPITVRRKSLDEFMSDLNKS